MHIAIEQQNIAQLGCAFNAGRVLIVEKYAFRTLPCQVIYLLAQICYGLFRRWTSLVKPVKQVSFNLLANSVVEKFVVAAGVNIQCFVFRRDNPVKFY